MRAKRSLWNFLTLVAGAPIAVACSMAATPYLLLWLGAERFGLLRVLIEITGYLVFLEFGLSEALIALLAASVDSKTELRSALAAGIRAHALMIPAKLAVGAVLTAVVPSLVAASPELASELRWATAIAVAASLLAPLTPLRLLLEVRQQGYLVGLALTVQQLVITGLCLVLAKAGLGLAGQTLAMLVGGAVFAVFPVIKTWGVLGGVKDGLGARRAWRGLWRLNWTQLAANLCGRASTMSDHLIISWGLGAREVTAFAVTQRTVMAVQAQLFGVGNATWAALSELHQRGERERFRERVLELTRLIVVSGLVTLGPLVAFNHRFVALWIGDSQFGGELLTLASAANALLSALIALWSWIFSATGRAFRLLPQYVAYAVINVVCSLGATRWLGLPGPAVGTLIATLAVSIWVVPIFLERDYGVRVRDLARAGARPVVALSVPFTLVLIVARRTTELSWPGLVLALVGAGIWLAIWAWSLGLSQAERATWRQRVVALVGAKPAAVPEETLPRAV